MITIIVIQQRRVYPSHAVVNEARRVRRTYNRCTFCKSTAPFYFVYFIVIFMFSAPYSVHVTFVKLPPPFPLLSIC